MGVSLTAPVDASTTPSPERGLPLIEPKLPPTIKLEPEIDKAPTLVEVELDVPCTFGFQSSKLPLVTSKAARRLRIDPPLPPISSKPPPTYRVFPDTRKDLTPDMFGFHASSDPLVASTAAAYLREVPPDT
jgi:hypothetical protein